MLRNLYFIKTTSFINYSNVLANDVLTNDVLTNDVLTARPYECCPYECCAIIMLDSVPRTNGLFHYNAGSEPLPKGRAQLIAAGPKEHASSGPRSPSRVSSRFDLISEPARIRVKTRGHIMHAVTLLCTSRQPTTPKSVPNHFRSFNIVFCILFTVFWGIGMNSLPKSSFRLCIKFHSSSSVCVQI